MKFFHVDLKHVQDKAPWSEPADIPPYYECEILHGNSRLYMRTYTSHAKPVVEHFAQISYNKHAGRSSPGFATELEAVQWAEKEVISLLNQQVSYIEQFKKHLQGDPRGDTINEINEGIHSRLNG